MSFSAIHLVQVVVALGLLNVWLLRAGLATGFRGGQASSLKEEFRVYGLPDFMFYLVGTLKIVSALGLLAGIWMPALTQPSAIMVVVLMLGALSMHIKVKDPFVKSIPALFMLLMSAAIVIW